METTPITIKQSAQEAEAMKVENDAANQKFESKKDGNDPVEIESDIGFDLYLHINNGQNEKCDAKAMGEGSEYVRYHFRVNKNALYYGDVAVIT